MLKQSQILRTAVATTSISGLDVPAMARVVVQEVRTDGTARVKVADATLPSLAKAQVVVKVTDLTATKRGRPRKGA